LNIRIINPVEYLDWDSLLLQSNNHSFFHTSAWAKVLQESYGFLPINFVMFEKDRFSMIIPMMEVHSPLIGKRGVSLPFTDQCSPYYLKMENLQDGVQSVIKFGENNKWRYIDWRDGGYFTERIPPWEVYYKHDIDLDKSESGLFSVLNDNNRRNIKKAIRENVTIKIDQKFDSMKSFCQLNCITRKRHGLPPQPFTFFKSVFTNIISPGDGAIISAFYKENMIASSVFFHFGKNVLFKFGASEMEHQNLRPNNLIMWEAIKWYRHRGFESINLGRTERHNQGLLQYKRTWGAKESLVKYYRYDVDKKTYRQKRQGSGDFYTKIFARTPKFLLRIFGRLFYRHAG
jgi:hypothetical protein